MVSASLRAPSQPCALMRLAVHAPARKALAGKENRPKRTVFRRTRAVLACLVFRVFPPIASQQGAHDAAPYGAMDGGRASNALQDSALEREVQQLRDALAAMREDRDTTRVDRDAWRDLARKEGDERREMAQRLALAAPIAASGPIPAPRRPWWRRLAG